MNKSTVAWKIRTSFYTNQKVMLKTGHFPYYLISHYPLDLVFHLLIETVELECFHE